MAAPKRLAKPQSMDSPEREYLRHLLTYQKAYKSLVVSSLSFLLPALQLEVREMHKDLNESLLKDMRKNDSLYGTLRWDANFEEELRKLFESVQKRLQVLFPNSLLRRWSQNMVANVNNVSKRNIVKAAKSADLEIEPLLKDDKLNPFFDNVVDANIGLIRSISSDKMTSFKTALVDALSQDMSKDTFAKIIRDQFDVTRSKARIIARDQVNKLNGSLNKYRQEQLGGERYIWRTSGDERVREDHHKLDGKIFYWSKPPITNRRKKTKNHPGLDINCRCIAEMVLSDVVNSF